MGEWNLKDVGSLGKAINDGSGWNIQAPSPPSTLVYLIPLITSLDPPHIIYVFGPSRGASIKLLPLTCLDTVNLSVCLPLL